MPAFTELIRARLTDTGDVHPLVSANTPEAPPARSLDSGPKPDANQPEPISARQAAVLDVIALLAVQENPIGSHATGRIQFEPFAFPWMPTDAEPDTEGLGRVVALCEQIEHMTPPEDGVPITPQAKFAACGLVTNLYSAHGVRCDEVHPLEDGGVEIIAHGYDWEMCCWVFSPDMIEYLCKRGTHLVSRKATLLETPGQIWDFVKG